MLHVVTPSTVSNRSALKIRKVPRKLSAYGFGVLPPGSFGSSIYWRMVMEVSFLRYLLALSPFPVLILMFPDLALPIGQAPALMFLMVYLVESRVLSVDNPERRRRLMPEEEAEQGADIAKVRGRDILTRIAAKRGLKAGELHMVIEQSALARIAPLTIVSVQSDMPEPHVLDLDAEEQQLIRDTLFDAEFTEQRMHISSLALGRFMHDVTLEARSVSAHARLEALATA
ncbi:hypothetical protein SAMN05444722_2846 [Rhodovulum sp. ES.010]|uniref:hypothetical protein n=1 Tax=Rhodovulum sp. ES.010 TaxID=1882821 RepID=UPI000926B5E1|nr:hypothetical protein [Rhodovulum sp. ES.010]SIO50729.1 hypothetical protein SAMN05444722_2846 [Rhodovulum sp. ES.010]